MERETFSVGKIHCCGRTRNVFGREFNDEHDSESSGQHCIVAEPQF